MTFDMLSLVMIAACCILGARFIFAGRSVLNEWGLEATIGSLILFRRTGIMYFGLALIFFLGRTAAPSHIRSAVCLVMGGISLLLACLRAVEFANKRVSAGIFRSVVAEALVGAAFLWVWWSGG